MQHPTTTSFSLLPPTSPHTPVSVPVSLSTHASMPMSMSMPMTMSMPMSVPISSQTTTSPSIPPSQTAITATPPTTIAGISKSKLLGKPSKSGNSTSPVSQSSQRRTMEMATHYMTCCKCGKKRAVPMYVAMIG